MRIFKSAVGIRGDMLYCPLPLYIDSYWTCEANCAHCYSRRLNRTWGTDFRAADVESVKKKLLSNKGTSPLSMAIKQRKTLRLGNRADPFQDWEEKHQISTKILEFLVEENWETVIQTMYPRRAWEMTGLGPNCIMMAQITVGLEDDWELFEYQRTENPIDRIKTLSRIKKKGFRVGVNGEPFIPGFHTVKQFEETVKLLKSHGINRFNTYNLHFNDWVAKNFHQLGLDIEKIWYMNKDTQWRGILRRLLDVADKHGIILGCPDFVNSGWDNVQKCNTCCGLDVTNPCTWNTHHFKLAQQKGENPIDKWDTVGNYQDGIEIIVGGKIDMYTLKDIAGGKVEEKKGDMRLL